MADAPRIDVFISYALADEALRSDNLELRLTNLRADLT